MKAVVFQAPRAFGVEQLPKPRPGPGEVRVAMSIAGICGTDVHIHDGTFFASFPLTPGHEPAGIVDELGEGVDSPSVGQLVAVNGNSGCGACLFCRRGRPLLCRNLRALGVTGPGGFAEYMLAPSSQCFPIDDLEPDVAVMVEPTACAVHGVETLAMSPGSDALVFGAGPTGLMLAQLLLHGGAARVTVAAPTEFKLELARSFGVDETVRIDRHDADEAGARLRNVAPDGFDVVVDATGASTISAQAISLARDGGTVLWYGVVPPDDRIGVSPYEIYRRELTIKGSFAQVDCFPRSIAMLRSGRVRTEGVITHRFSLDRFGEAIDTVRSEPGCLKAVLEL
jgi:D-arabinitol dehydrogenase (NADP+)